MTDTDLAVYEPTSRHQHHLISSAVACKLGAPGKSGNCNYPGISEIHADQPMLSVVMTLALPPGHPHPAVISQPCRKQSHSQTLPNLLFSGNKTSSKYDFSPWLQDNIIEYGSTLYVGMAWGKNGVHISRV